MRPKPYHGSWPCTHTTRALTITTLTPSIMEVSSPGLFLFCPLQQPSPSQPSALPRPQACISPLSPVHCCIHAAANAAPSFLNPTPHGARPQAHPGVTLSVPLSRASVVEPQRRVDPSIARTHTPPAIFFCLPRLLPLSDTSSQLPIPTRSTTLHRRRHARQMRLWPGSSFFIFSLPSALRLHRARPPTPVSLHAFPSVSFSLSRSQR